jgi:hypothetical protein
VVPSVIGLQVPVAHELHVPHAVWQQISETQFPFWHWSLALQLAPSLPCLVQVPDAQ